MCLEPSNNPVINTRKFDLLHGEFLKRLAPDDHMRAALDKVINELTHKIEEVIKDLNFGFPIEPVLVGSTAKDTFLAEPDIDLFIMFPTSVSVDRLRELGLVVGRNVLPNGEERYAEHPYISGRFSGFETDIVPCYKLVSIEDKMTAVDRTPFHTEYIKGHLQATQCDEVRLLKQFMKGIGAYGAEIEIQGFSGYLCEILILKYDTFLKLIEAASAWPVELVLSLDNGAQENSPTKIRYRSKSTLSKKFSDKFKNEPLVFLDPVDRSRNVASAVVEEKLKLFIHAARAYIKDPKPEFFFPKPVRPRSLPQLTKSLAAKPGTVIGIRFGTPEVVPDILHGQLHKCVRAIQKVFDTAGFNVTHAKYYQNEQTIMLFELAKAELPEIETHQGPPEGHKNVSSFLAKWNNSSIAVGKPYLKAQRWFVDIKREFIKPVDLIKAKIFELNIGKHIKTEIDKNLEIYEGDSVIRKGFEHALTLFLEPKYNWEY